MSAKIRRFTKLVGSILISGATYFIYVILVGSFSLLYSALPFSGCGSHFDPLYMGVKRVVFSVDSGGDSRQAKALEDKMRSEFLSHYQSRLKSCVSPKSPLYVGIETDLDIRHYKPREGDLYIAVSLRRQQKVKEILSQEEASYDARTLVDVLNIRATNISFAPLNPQSRIILNANSSDEEVLAKMKRFLPQKHDYVVPRSSCLFRTKKRGSTPDYIMAARLKICRFHHSDWCASNMPGFRVN